MMLFQSLRGVLVGFRLRINPEGLFRQKFQSLRGVLVGFRRHGPRTRGECRVSIPKRGFGGFSPWELCQRYQHSCSFNP